MLNCFACTVLENMLSVVTISKYKSGNEGEIKFLTYMLYSVVFVQRIFIANIRRLRQPVYGFGFTVLRLLKADSQPDRPNIVQL